MHGMKLWVLWVDDRLPFDHVLSLFYQCMPWEYFKVINIVGQLFSKDSQINSACWRKQVKMNCSAFWTSSWLLLVSIALGRKRHILTCIDDQHHYWWSKEWTNYCLQHLYSGSGSSFLYQETLWLFTPFQRSFDQLLFLLAWNYLGTSIKGSFWYKNPVYFYGK